MITTVLAQHLQNPVLPPALGNVPILPAGATPITLILGVVIRLLVVMGGIVMILYLMVGAFNWITAEGKPDKLEHARNTVVHAIVGMVLLAATVAITSLIGGALNIEFLKTLNINIPGI